MKKKIILIFTAVIAMLVVAMGWIVVSSGFIIEHPTAIYIDSDDNVDSLRKKFDSVCRPSSDLAFNINISIFDIDNRMHTGRYVVTPEMTAMQVLHRIRNHNEDPLNLVVPSVRTMGDMAQRLASQLMVDSASIMRALNDETLIKSMGYSKQTLPCLFVPNTYQVYWDVTVDNLLKRMKRESENFWTDDRKAKLAEVSEYAGEEMTISKVVTLASIVDSETANNGEKPIIAALYMNRMRINMPLQSDPTVKFALQDFALRRIMHKHLEVDSPYNTYKNKGLPPGPICVPSIAGIDAVLNHSRNDYIYMCAKEDFSGTHNFAVSYAEHQRNAARYVSALNKRNIH